MYRCCAAPVVCQGFMFHKFLEARKASELLTYYASWKSNKYYYKKCERVMNDTTTPRLAAGNKHRAAPDQDKIMIN